MTRVTRRAEAAAHTAALDRLLEHSGIIPLRPTYVRRFYMDGGRLGLASTIGGTLRPHEHLWVSERWIASTTPAANPHPIPDEGMSRLALNAGALTLADALRLRGPRLLGASRWKAHGPEFRVLTKILDAAEPIVFHFHARDRDVARFPQYFPGHRFGKDEAYYFLDAPRGAVPYTHAGLHPGVSRRDLQRATESGRDALFDVSPVFVQSAGRAFYVPSGIPHRPGTALTLEIQQPSDVATMLEPVGGRRLAPDKFNPGFPDLRTALRFVDMETATAPDFIERHLLDPMPVRSTRQSGGTEDWIFPPSLGKFSGKRLRVRRRFESVEDGPYAVLVWGGRGRVNNVPLRAGMELFVGDEAARRPHLFEASGSEVLEAFKIFPAPL
jgi:hypothetical protein